jgi:uncharacterized protein (DUF2147 family)
MRVMLTVIAAGLALAAPAAAREGPEGRWVAVDEDAIVEIAPCGEALCGTVVEVLSRQEAGLAEAGDVPGVGSKILVNLKPSGNGTWSGKAVSRAKGKTYYCDIEMLDPQRLKLRPYVGIPLFGETLIWERAPE